MNMMELSEVQGRPWDDVDVGNRIYPAKWKVGTLLTYILALD